jgi:hypothetical protein
MLKFIVDSLEGVDQAVATMYEKQDDGKFRLNVDGAVPREKLDEFRNTNIELLKKVDAYKGVDVKKYTDLLALEKRVTDKELVDSGKVDEVVQGRISQMKTEHEGAVGQLNEQLSIANRQLETLLIDSAVRVKALESGVLPTAVDDVMLRAKTAFKIIEGRAVPHSDGKVVYGKDGVNPMSVEEWIGGLSKAAPHLFGSTQGGGASGSRTTGNRGGSGQKLTSTQKIAAGLSGR